MYEDFYDNELEDIDEYELEKLIYEDENDELEEEYEEYFDDGYIEDYPDIENED